MAEETFAQRLERLAQERNRPALLAEARQLLTIYLDGDDDLNVEPIVSALFILQHLTTLQHSTQPEQGGEHPSQDLWNQKYPITSVTRAALVSGGVSQEHASLLSDADMRAIASRMEDQISTAITAFGTIWARLRSTSRSGSSHSSIPRFRPLEL